MNTRINVKADYVYNELKMAVTKIIVLFNIFVNSVLCVHVKSTSYVNISASNFVVEH